MRMIDFGPYFRSTENRYAESAAILMALEAWCSAEFDPTLASGPPNHASKSSS